MITGKPPGPTDGTSAARSTVPTTTRGRLEIAAEALRLRDEQLKAQVTYVDPGLETNAELDAITAQVVAELKQLQKEARAPAPVLDTRQIETGLIKNLRALLEKLLSPRRERFLALRVQNIQRRITSLFFSTEVLAAPNDDSGVRLVYAHPDDAMLHVIRRHEKAILADLETMRFADPQVKTDAIERLKLFQKQLMSQVLSRSRPDLERLLGIYADLLTRFLLADFPAALGEFAWEVIAESQVAKNSTFSYKLHEKRFSAFRRAFERRFLEHLLASVQQPLAQRLESGEGGDFRPETIRFAADPRIYAEICDVMCSAIYDYLHGEGYLDLPVKWQEHLAQQH